MAAGRAITGRRSHEAMLAVREESHVVHLSLPSIARLHHLALVTVGAWFDRFLVVLDISSALSLVAWLSYHLLATLSLNYIFLP